MIIMKSFVIHNGMNYYYGKLYKKEILNNTFVDFELKKTVWCHNLKTKIQIIFTGGAISLEAWTVLVGEAVCQQNANNEFDEIKN